ncbi:MAG TPA: PA2779 family protein [Terriglobales bacterium]|jgi:hypothetical protein
MLDALKQFAHGVTACVLIVIFALPANLAAQASNRLVSPSDLQKAAVDASRARQHNLDTVRNFLSSERAQKALKSSNMDTQQVKTAVASLSDAELAQLAARADKAQADFAAGDLSDRDLILIILGIAVLVLIIVAVR